MPDQKNETISCLLIIQKRYHSFGKYIKDALVAKGYTVTVANDEYPAGFIGKLMGKLRFPLIFPLTYKHIAKHFIDGKKYDVAIIIRGRGVSKTLVQKMSETIPKIVGYNWDTFDFNKNALKWFKYVNNYYTFDYVDADAHSIPNLELFSSLPLDEAKKTIKYDISAVGRNYPGRLKYINQVFGILNPERTYIHLYENNILELALNIIKNPGLYIKYWKYIHFHPLSYISYLDIIRSSEFTIDYANNGQTGITMRCYESVSMQTKLITNNDYLKRSKYFNDTNFIVYDAHKPVQKLVDDYKVCKEAPYEPHVRTISSFVDDLTA